jgi:hypothetical protein
MEGESGRGEIHRLLQYKRVGEERSAAVMVREGELMGESTVNEEEKVPRTEMKERKNGKGKC